MDKHTHTEEGKKKRKKVFSMQRNQPIDTEKKKEKDEKNCRTLTSKEVDVSTLPVWT